jgi:putative ABC transport system substrate-binding protein
MRRRQFLGVLGGGAAAWPIVARGEHRLPIIGLMSSAAAEPSVSRLAVFLNGLKTAGFVEGQNVKMEYRWASGNYGELPKFAAEFVAMPVDIIVSFDNTATALAAKAATSSIPIVFALGTDPVKFGLVKSLNRPDGNLTGVVSLTVGLATKRFQVLRELLPRSEAFGLLINPKNPAAEIETQAVLGAATTSGVQLTILRASSESEIESAFEAAIRSKLPGIVVVSEPFLTSRAQQVASLALRNSIPVIDAYRSFVDSGGLISYGASLEEASRVAGIYAGRIIKGEKPQNLSIQQSTKIQLVINLKTAEKFGIAVPTSLLVRADEVIE